MQLNDQGMKKKKSYRVRRGGEEKNMQVHIVVSKNRRSKIEEKGKS